MSIQMKKLYLMLSRVIFVIGVGSCIGIYTNSNMENPTVLDILLMIVLLVLLFGGTSILGHYIKSIVFIEINDGQAQMQLLSGRLVNFACSDVKKVEKKERWIPPDHGKRQKISFQQLGISDYCRKHGGQPHWTGAGRLPGRRVRGVSTCFRK